MTDQRPGDADGLDDELDDDSVTPDEHDPDEHDPDDADTPGDPEPDDADTPGEPEPDEADVGHDDLAIPDEADHDEDDADHDRAADEVSPDRDTAEANGGRADTLDERPTVDEVSAVAASHRRVSRWDRPPPPRDWRWVVGAIGRTLIATGVLMFGFVAYQLWGTGIETARAQSRLEAEFEALVDATVPAATTPPSPATTSPATTSPATTSPVTTNGPATSAPTTTTPSDGGPGTPSTTVAAPEPPPIEPGGPLARLEIPRIDKTGGDALYVVSGVDPESLQLGPGHYPDTPLPGQLGNAAIAGHRTTWGEPFARIDELEPGDEIVVTMLSGERYVYHVADTLIVGPSDYWVVGTTDPTVAQLTLTSCHPRFSASERIVVQAFLVPAESAPPGETVDDTGVAPGATAPSSVAPASTAPPSTAPVSTPAVSTPAVSTAPTVPVTSVVVEPPPPPANGQTIGADALTEGWFHDPAAWPHIVAWGAVCAAIALVTRLLSRRFRSHPTGVAIGVAPFLFALYFLYQNVNRLLPPGL